MFLAVTMCPAPGQTTSILFVRRVPTSQPGIIAANLFVRRAGKLGDWGRPAARAARTNCYKSICPASAFIKGMLL